MPCQVTAINPDGRFSTLEVDARTVNYAVIHYNAMAVTSRALELLIPERETAFKIEAAGKTYETTWGKVTDWANREANKTVRTSRRQPTISR